MNGVPPTIGARAEDRRRVPLAFGATLRELRRARGVTQEELALIGGFNRTYTSLLERGLRTPTLTVLFRLAEALSVGPCRVVLLTEQHLTK